MHARGFVRALQDCKGGNSLIATHRLFSGPMSYDGILEAKSLMSCALWHRILEEEDNLIAAHRWQIEETMAIVRQEMTLLGQVGVLQRPFASP